MTVTRFFTLTSVTHHSSREPYPLGIHRHRSLSPSTDKQTRFNSPMASKPIRRSITGLTNKSSSNPTLSSSAATKAATEGGHGKQCVCKTCTCGRHRCTGRDHSNVTSVGGNAPFEGFTENRSEYKAHTIPPRPPVSRAKDMLSVDVCVAKGTR